MDHLLHSTNTSNHKGLVQTIYAIPAADITAFPALTASPTTDAQRITRSGSFTLASGKFWKKIQLTAGTGKLITKPVGGPRQNSFETTLELKRANVDAEAYGWLAANANEELVFVAPNRNGVQVIVGDPLQGCYLEPDGGVDSGAAAGDEAGLMLKFKHEGPVPSIWSGTPALS